MEQYKNLLANAISDEATIDLKCNEGDLFEILNERQFTKCVGRR